ncbi:MAG: HyaD/HybD family hydrogenase maturation endopeptidase [Maricaulaceae bacterium]
MIGPAPETLVLGVGNVLWADEGFGVRCVEAMAETFEEPPGVVFMDGGTQGLQLVNVLAEAKNVLIFDAVDFGAKPGTLITARGDDVPRFVAGKKVSLHQTSMMEVLAVAELMTDRLPEQLTLVGCQPFELEDYGGGLTPGVAAKVAPALVLAQEELAIWGVTLTPSTRAEPLMPQAVERARYEGERPSEATACRIGDARVLARKLQPSDG